MGLCRIFVDFVLFDGEKNSRSELLQIIQCGTDDFIHVVIPILSQPTAKVHLGFCCCQPLVLCVQRTVFCIVYRVNCDYYS